MDDSSMAFAGAVFQGHGMLRSRDDRSVDMRQEIVAATAFVLTLATIVTVLRAYVRRFILRQWGMDDWASMVSYVLVLATGIIIALTTHYGIGTPLMSIPPEKVYMAATLTKVSIITYQAAVTSLKATFLLQYRRIFPLPNFQRLCDAVFIFNLLFGLSLVLSFAIRCTPPSAAWKFPPPPGPPPRCFDVIVWWYVNAGVNLATDVIILIMPVPLLRSLPLARKPKMILIGVFALGSFTTAINIIRITSLKNAASVRGATYSASLSSIFAIVELCSATVCVCVPTLRPLIGNARRQMSFLRGKKGSSSKIAASPLDSAASSGANSERIDKAIPTPALRAFHFQGRESGSLKPQGRKTRPRAYDLELGPVAALRRDLSMAWTVGTGTGTGNETDDEYGGVETRDEPLTPLCPPPRSHVAGDSRTGSRGG